MMNRSISQRIKEIDEQISALYRERRALEMEQQRYWEEMYWPRPLSVEDVENFEEIYYENYNNSGSFAFDNEPSGTLLG